MSLPASRKTLAQRVMRAGIAVGIAHLLFKLAGLIQVVMATGHDTIRAALPIWAGLKILNPRPPIECFATTMANAEPSAVI